MKGKEGQDMHGKLITNNEKVGNICLLAFICVVSVVGWSAVMLFLNGGMRECIFPLGGVVAIIIKLFEKKLGSTARYIYALIPPFIGAITNSVCSTPDSDSYVAITFYYMAATVLVALYLDTKLLITNGIVTFAINVVLMIIFPAGFFKLHNVIGWIFFWIFYFILFAGCLLSVYRTNYLFGVVEEKGKEAEDVLKNVQYAFAGLEQSSVKIFDSLQDFEANTEEIAVSTNEITDSADVQIKEVERSLDVFGRLNEKIANSEQRINQTVEIMKELKTKNDEGIAAIEELVQKFDENIKTTKIASEGVEDLSQKSNAIVGIIESIRNIAQQTNLLALNAAIEAARAGEAGRGFAVVADEINSLSAESSDATGKIDSILKDIIETVGKTHKVIDQNNKAVIDSNEKLEDTVKNFNIMLQSSEAVIKVTELLKNELEDIIQIKEQLLSAMECVQDISQKSVSTTEEISAAIEEQVTGVESILLNMEMVKNSINHLSVVLGENKEE